VRVGLTVPFHALPLSALPSLVRLAERAGYDSVWSEESVNLDGVTPLAVAALASERMRLASGVLGVFTRGPAVLAQTAAALAQLSGGRFVLGLGVSSQVIVGRWNGTSFERPLEKMRATVDYLRPVLAGGRGPGGFKLAEAPSHEVPIVIAALRPRMLRLAAEAADGAFTNFLPLSGATRVAASFAAPGKELACRFFSVPGPEVEALAVARRVFAGYATVPVYRDYLAWLGWGDALEPVNAAWERGDRRLALELVPDELVREIFLLGPAEAQRERLAAFAEAGIGTAVITLLGPPAELGRWIDAFAPERSS
jgi:probable F420-dependent oxidoreductase